MSKKAKPTVNTSEPWKAVQPYLLGDELKEITGVLPEAGKLYEQGGFTPEMQGIADLYSGSVLNRATDPRLQGFTDFAYNDMLGGAKSLANGGMDTNFGAVKNINTPMVNLQSARKAQGQLDPTNSLQSLLSGQVTSPYLQQQADAMTSNLTRNMNENVMPGLRSEALASGQYGGSRQGIAEGLATSRLNQDLAPALTNLFGNAYENAQGRMFGTASQLNDQAFQNASNNANRQFSGNQFNANLGLQNNAQQMQQNTQNLSNRLQGANVANSALNMLGGVNGMQDNNFNQMMGALQMPQNMNWQNFQNFSNPILAGAGMGGTQSQTNYKNPAMGALGGAAAGAAFGPWGAAIGGGLGLLGGL